MRHRRPKKPTPCMYRLLVPLDVVDMVPMLQEWQAQAAAAVPYPRTSGPRAAYELASAIEQEIRSNPLFLHIGAVVNGAKAPDGTISRGKVKGFIVARVLQRMVGEPRLFALVQMLYVDKAFRARRIAPRLIYALTSLARKRFGIEHVECTYTPGTKAARTLERAGFRPYEVTAAFVGVDGGARDELPFDRASRRQRWGARWAQSSAAPPEAADKSFPPGPAPATTT